MLRCEVLESDAHELTRWCEIYVAGHNVESGGGDDPALLVGRVRTLNRISTQYFAAWNDDRLIGAASVHPEHQGVGPRSGYER